MDAMPYCVDQVISTPMVDKSATTMGVFSVLSTHRLNFLEVLRAVPLTMESWTKGLSYFIFTTSWEAMTGVIRTDGKKTMSPSANGTA